MSENEFTHDNTEDATHADSTSSGIRFLSVINGEIKYLNKGGWLELKDRKDINPPVIYLCRPKCECKGHFESVKEKAIDNLTKLMFDAYKNGNMYPSTYLNEDDARATAKYMVEHGVKWAGE